MAKQLIVSVLEDVVGEYFLNISKENLKIAALRGKIKLENVQLDGDLIGSHVLGAVGLPGFGVLSCWAKSVRMVVSWKNLEKEPTRFEIRGVHLVCVPLLPSTSARTHGAGTAVDPRCTLRTRVKRSALARFERNFFAGRIPGEGPPPRRSPRPHATENAEEENEKDDEDAEYLSSSRCSSDLNGDNKGDSDGNHVQMGTDQGNGGRNSSAPPEDWKAKLRAKVFRNIEISVRDVHLRCEVPKLGLGISTGHAERKISGQGKRSSRTISLSDEGAFAFGLTLESFVIKTATTDWGSGSSEGASPGCTSSASTATAGANRRTSGKNVRGPFPVDADDDRKLIELNNFSIYWDDEPPLLISDCAVFKSHDFYLPPIKLQARVAAAMSAMVLHQDPGGAIRKLLSPNESSLPFKKDVGSSGAPTKEHEFCISAFSAQVRTTLNLSLAASPMTCLAEFLPFSLDLCFRPHQYQQYHKLRSAILSQQRFDTMLRQRPKFKPSLNPKAWWKYAFACVTTRPNSRPWEDVVLISRSRHRYMELVEKKLLPSRDRNGYHGGLSESESAELLALENLLPIEVLHSFHLLALRNVYEIQRTGGTHKKGSERLSISPGKARVKPQSRSSLKLLRRAWSGGGGKGKQTYDCVYDEGAEYELCSQRNTEAQSLFAGKGSQSEKEVSMRVSRNPVHITVKMYDAAATLELLQAMHGKAIIRIDMKTSGTARTLHMGERELVFNVMRFEVFDCLHPVPSFSPSQLYSDGKVLGVKEALNCDISPFLPVEHPSSFSTSKNATHKISDNERGLEDRPTSLREGVTLPPEGVVCRLSASRDHSHLAMSISAHPATLVWSKPCIDAVADFFTSPSSEIQSELTRQLRNAATPLARKAQLALLSPIALCVNVNVAAPKLWVPVSSESSDGAVFLDSGRFKMTFVKQEKATDTNWEIAISDIQVDFVRGRLEPHESIAAPHVCNCRSIPDGIDNGEIRIVRPFHVHVLACLQEMHNLDERAFQSNQYLPGLNLVMDGPVRTVAVEISPICLNLVDAEVLARAIGKWYAHGIVRVRQREAIASSTQRSSKRQVHSSSIASSGLERFSEPRGATAGMVSSVATPHSVTITIEGIEMALQGHSKASIGSLEDKSLDTLGFRESNSGASPKIRTYLVDVRAIKVRRTNHLNKTMTRLTVSDASVVQLEEDFSCFPTERPYHPSQEHYYVLIRECTPGSPVDVSSKKSNPLASFVGTAKVDDFISDKENIGTSKRPPKDSAILVPVFPSSGLSESGILSAAHFHDGGQHLDEVEIDMDSLVIRVTPTSMKDCAKGLHRILELVQLMTKEMERKVHEEGRKARQKRAFQVRNYEIPNTPNPKPFGQVIGSPPFWEKHAEVKGVGGLSDSSILFKVVLKESTLLAGRPAFPMKIFSGTTEKASEPVIGKGEMSQLVIQILSNALIMFQSIENADRSGTKTVHISIDNMSASVNSEFQRIALSDVPPMIGPTSIEFRVVYATESLGCVVSQDISLDCDAVKACLSPSDMSALMSVSRNMVDRLRTIRLVGRPQKGSDPSAGAAPTAYLKRPGTFVSSIIHYQKKGTGVATCVRAEVQDYSFVLLRASPSKHKARPLLDFNVNQLKGKLEGCMSALSGECTAIFSVNFFQPDVIDWEYAVEPFSATLAVEQMPNEVILNLVITDAVQLNLTGALLRDFADVDFDTLGPHKEKENDNLRNGEKGLLSSSIAISSFGPRRAIESPYVSLNNKSGLHLYLRTKSKDNDDDMPDCIFVNSWSCTRIDPCYGAELFDMISNGSPALDLGLAQSHRARVGEWDFLFDLPLASSSGRSVSLYKMSPRFWVVAGINACPYKWGGCSGRSNPATTQPSQSGHALYHAEPVVEWCMQNQRLRSTFTDMFSLDKGRDLLSSMVWSPEDNMEAQLSCNKGSPASTMDGDVIEVESSSPGSSGCKKTIVTSTRCSSRSNWLRPYLKNDSPEWSDMTCILRMARERVMLPDDNWIWLNDWTVDLSGKFGESTDADGWEYEADFETFNRKRRYYQRGDSCRRRKWTRTRIMKPPKVDDPYRQLYVVWETSRNENGNFEITVRSHVLIHNRTASKLTFFVYSPSWDEDVVAGTAESGGRLSVPIPLASAIYLRIAMNRDLLYQTGSFVHEAASLKDFFVSHRVMILPTSYTSSVSIRTTIAKEPDGKNQLHFLVHVRCLKGVVDIFVEPVVWIVNLLPCEICCRLGEVCLSRDAKRSESSGSAIGVKGKRIRSRETVKVPTGKEGSCTALDPALKPHISFRVPGYQWSLWQRIVNRKANSCTWQAPEEEEELHVHASKGDVDHAEEYKSLVRFERIGKAGDPLVLIMSVEVGHCPTIRIYAQYWILDKTGFGCRFSEGFNDLLGTAPDGETSRRSHLLQEEARNPDIQNDMSIPGHQWAIGMSGMTMYFSRKERITLSIEAGTFGKKGFRSPGSSRSKWVSPMDVSNVMPKTVVSVDEHGGDKRFELAMSVTVCPSVFARTKLVTLFPRYQIVNLLDKELHVAQDGCLKSVTRIPSQSSIAFHWEKRSLPPKVRLGVAATYEHTYDSFDYCWTNGCIQLDKVGITSMRVPTKEDDGLKQMVVQSEVRLASKYQSSAVAVVIWSTNEKSNPLYLLRNRTLRTILCRQPLQDEPGEKVDTELLPLNGCSGVGGLGNNGNSSRAVFECGTNLGPIINAFLGLDRKEEFVWILQSGEVACFGFDDPEKPHILEWTYVNRSMHLFDERNKKAVLEVDAMGSWSSLSFSDGREVRCHICAEHSTKVIEFVERFSGAHYGVRSTEPGSITQEDRKVHCEVAFNAREADSFSSDCRVGIGDDDEDLAFSLRMEVPEVSISVVDNASVDVHGREILLAQFDAITVEFSQSREGYHELEVRLMSLQVDNHVHKSIHPVLVFCPRLEGNEPFFHLSAVRRLQPHSTTFVFRYAAIRVLEIDIFLDRRTAEAVARFIQPLRKVKEANSGDPRDWVSALTSSMCSDFATPRCQAPRDVENMVHTANSGRIYFEQLHLHPVRLGLTFTQEWIEWNPGTEGMMIFHFIRGMASVANAPLTFTSFVVGHAFESPQALLRIISTHYSSQLTKQIFGILGSLAILGAPADFISNVGTGVRDFFYEPINGMVHGPAQFIEGLEAGTQSLARGVFVGVVRGAANVAEAVNSNLAGLTADDDFIDERKAHQRMLTDAMSRGSSNRTIGDSLFLAGASVARGVKSGAMGIMEQPAVYASKHGPLGFVKGVGKAFVGAIVKPVVGVGDAAVLVMNHVSEATSNKQVLLKIPKRLRRALPRRSADRPYSVRLVPYDERAAKAQKIVTGGESVDDVYIGHVNILSHLVIASDQCLWAIDRRSREPWCVSWEEISHFGMVEGGAMRVTVFSQMGLKSYLFHVETPAEFAALYELLAMQIGKMGNCSSNLDELDSSLFNGGLENLSKYQIPGIKATQVNHVFGSCNNKRKRISSTVKDEIDVIEHCFARVKVLGSESPVFFKTLDEEAWTLVNSWGQVFSGLSSRRCIAASIINGTGFAIQITSTKLVEGGSPCYSIPSKEFDQEQDVLHPGGAIIFFGWGSVPNLLQGGNVFMNIETNAFVSDLSDHKSRSTFAVPLPGYQVGFLEKSYDESGWWAKYWLLVRKA